MLPERRENLIAWLFLLPLLFALGVFILLPVAGTVATSLQRAVTYLPREWVQLDNFRRLLIDPGFHQALSFTTLFTLVSVPLELFLGLLFALLLHQPFPGRGVLRAIVLIPWAIPAAVSGRAFELIYHYSHGLANSLLGAAGLIEEPVNWLGSAPGAFAAVVLADAWKTTPFVAIVLLAGLSAIPDDLYRQAEIDRAHFLQRFFHLTLPLLRPVLVVAVLFRTSDAVRIFDLVYVLTGGGPGGVTSSLSLYGYRYFLAGDFGYGSAVAVVLFVLALVLALLTIRLGRFRQEVL